MVWWPKPHLGLGFPGEVVWSCRCDMAQLLQRKVANLTNQVRGTLIKFGEHFGNLGNVLDIWGNVDQKIRFFVIYFHFPVHFIFGKVLCVALSLAVLQCG